MGELTARSVAGGSQRGPVDEEVRFQSKLSPLDQ